MHFDFDDTVARAGLTTATLNVKTKTACFIATNFSLGLGGEELTNSGEDASISGRIGTRSATNWTLINHNTFIQILNTVNTGMLAWYGLGTMKSSKKFIGKNFVN